MDTSPIPQGLDPTAFILTKAIKRSESSGSNDPYKITGDNGTSTGAYQIQKKNWPVWAKQYLGDANADPNDEANQNKVAYSRVKELLDKGHSQSQVASIWNSGNPDAAAVGKGRNEKLGVDYDVPGYVSKVQKHYAAIQQEIKNGFNATPYSAPSTGESPAAKPAPSQTSQEPQEEGLGTKLKNRAMDASKALSDAAGGKINPISGVLQTAGAGAGAVNDIVGAGINLIPGVKQVTGLIGKGVAAAANTAPGKAVVGAGQNFAQEHPELTADLGAAGNIAGAATIFSGAGAAKELIGGKVAGLLGKEALTGVAEEVAPELGARAAAKSVAKQGLVKTAIRGEIKPVATTAAKDLAAAVEQYVPNFKKLGTFAEKVNATRDAVYSEADKLSQAIAQSGKYRNYTFKELASTLKKVEKPVLISSDATLNNAYDRVVTKALQLSQENGGTIPGLFEARKGLDQFVSQQFPNLYSSETLTPMRSAVRNIRTAMNDFIEQRLPEGSGYRQSLRDQSKLFEAIDNMSGKAAKEIGSTRTSRFAARHPRIVGTTKGLLNAGKTAALGALGFEGASHFLGGQGR